MVVSVSSAVADMERTDDVVVLVRGGVTTEADGMGAKAMAVVAQVSIHAAEASFIFAFQFF